MAYQLQLGRLCAHYASCQASSPTATQIQPGKIGGIVTFDPDGTTVVKRHVRRGSHRLHILECERNIPGPIVERVDHVARVHVDDVALRLFAGHEAEIFRPAESIQIA